MGERVGDAHASAPVVIDLVVKALGRIESVIDVRNGAAELGQQLEALASQEFDRTWEVVIVDNGSTDSSAQLALSFAGRLPVRVVDASDKPGRSHALNRGVDEARGLNLVFLDADDEIASGSCRRWFAPSTTTRSLPVVLTMPR